MKAQIGISSKSDKLEMRYKPQIISKTTDQELKQEIINLFFINLLSKQKEKNSYDEGVADSRKEYSEELIGKEYLDFYQNGYHLGYSQGYEEAKRFFKKFIR